MTAPDLLRQLAQPALNSYANTVTVTVPTRLLTALADLVEADERPHDEECGTVWSDELSTLVCANLTGDCTVCLARAEVERAAKEHTSQ